MARHAFISHSHKDAEASNAIVAALESRGVKCWTAPRDVTPGGSYAESIITAIENSSCFVLVYTQNSNVSPHVLREVERALALGINIIPLRFDDSSISKEPRLPARHRALALRHRGAAPDRDPRRRRSHRFVCDRS